MTTPMNDADRCFDDNLRTLGSRTAAPPGIPDGVRAACQATLNDSGRMRCPRWHGVFGRPALLSTIGLAAALVLAVGLLFPTGGGPTVRAAVVLEKLATQVQGDNILEVTLDAVGVDEVFVQGRLQIAEKAIAGDIHATIQEEPDEPPVDVDASFAMSEAGGWVLIRKLSVPVEPEVAAIVAGLFPPGTETLLTFPANAAAEIIEKKVGDEAGKGLGELRALATGQLAKFLKEVINSQTDVGATVTNQPDGTVLVTIEVRDAESLGKLMEMAKSAMGEPMDGPIDINDNDAKGLVGCLLRVVYDPRVETVRSFSISNVGDMKGTVTISLRGGTIEPGMLDPARVTTPNTRTFDVGAIVSIVNTLQGNGKSAE